MTSGATNTQSTSNFSFLEGNWPDLASLAAFAESYARSDPQSAQVKIRIFAERMVEILYYVLGLTKTVEAEASKARANELDQSLAQVEKSKQEEVERLSKEKEQLEKAQQEELEALKTRIAGLERSWWKKFLGVSS